MYLIAYILVIFIFNKDLIETKSLNENNTQVDSIYFIQTQDNKNLEGTLKKIDTQFKRNSSESQKWRFKKLNGDYYFIQNVGNKLCISNAPNHNTVRLEACDNTELNNKWKIIGNNCFNSNNYCIIQSFDTNYNLVYKKNRVFISPNGGIKWRLLITRLKVKINQQNFQIQTQIQNGLRFSLAIENNFLVKIEYNKNSSESQKWQFIKKNDYNYLIRNVGNKLCIANVPSINAIILESCDNTELNNKWKIIGNDCFNSNNDCTIQSSETKYYLDYKKVFVLTSSTSIKKWRLIKV